LNDQFTGKLKCNTYATQGEKLSFMISFRQLKPNNLQLFIYSTSGALSKRVKAKVFTSQK